MKLAVVTGGAGGLGRAIAARLAHENFRVVLFDRDAAAATAVAAQLPATCAIAVDILDEISVKAALAALDGPIDLLVNNAGITAGGGLTQSIDEFRRIIEVNLIGTYMLSRLIASAMAERGSGVIVNVTSAASIAAAPAVGGYGPSKSAIANLTKAFALEYAPRGVRVNAVAPGFIAAGLGAGNAADPALVERRTSRVPARSLGTAEEVAGVVAFLASDDARYIHGQEIVVDGGLTLTALANTLA